MSQLEYDVVLAGGGPAGSNAARIVKQYRSDLDVALFERGSQPSANCAGGLGIPFYRHLGYKPPEEVIQSPIREVVLASPNEEVSVSVDDIDIDSISWIDYDSDEMGWIVDRQAWDNYQLDKAREAGVDVFTKHSVQDIQQDEGVELTITSRDAGNDISVSADYVGLAVGANWKLAAKAGFDYEQIEPSKDRLYMGLQYHMKDPDYMSDYGYDTIYLLFDRRWSPNGYVWSFPEGKEYTRWGGTVPLSSDKNIKHTLNEYLKREDKNKYRRRSCRQTTNALIPTASPLDTCVSGRVALIGDTARHCDPLHGGGMLHGSRAGKAFAKSVTRGNIDMYDEEWKDAIMQTLQHRAVLSDLVHNMDNDEYDRLVGAMSDFNVTSLNPDKEVPRLLHHCLMNDPKIFTKAAASATKSIVMDRFNSFSN